MVGIRRAKNESSYTRRGLHVDTKKEGFHQRSKGISFGKSNFSGLEGVLARPPSVFLRSKR